MIKITDSDGTIIFDVRVVPQASRSEIIGVQNGILKIRIASPPVDGAANIDKIIVKEIRRIEERCRDRRR